MDATAIAAAYVDGATLTALVATHNTNSHHIRKALRTQGVSLRTRSEVAKLREYNDVPLPPEMIQRVEGELLGDGSLKLQKHQSFFSFRTSDLNYAGWRTFSSTTACR